MPHIKLICLIAALLLSNNLSAREPTSLEGTYFLAKNQIAQVTTRALEGSGDDALSLSRYYSNVKLDLDAALKWAIVGAENGNANCMYTAYAFLEKRESDEDRRRSVFWLKKAVSLGYKPAIEHQKIIKP
jgi:TPR repeat protein